MLFRSTPPAPTTETEAPVETPPTEAAPAAQEATFEPAENGYFFRKMPDGSYDQTVYVQNEAGEYEPYQG